MHTLLEITYKEDLNPFSELENARLTYIENYVEGKHIFQLKINHSYERVIEKLQQLCKTMNIKLDITENSEPEAVGEIIKVLGGGAIGGVQGGVYGFVFAKVLEAIKKNMGGEKALEVFIENFIGIDIFIPGMGQIIMISTFTNALINGVVAHFTLKDVKVEVHFQKPTNNNYKALIFNFA